MQQQTFFAQTYNVRKGHSERGEGLPHVMLRIMIPICESLGLRRTHTDTGGINYGLR